ncbi:efflux RND transporter permease subunit [Gallaecimonas mangrovi]|uniref:efflux RND transporter permease subunit n=1 Tax=Gallaecimonas mangrovi TaxID=2291597 RepID=UPI000E2049F9|nr:efflux RND transporter permease subunit [Gallaecimonas mangrovi]
MPRFFIDRPIFAWVIAILIMLAGVIAIYRLPIAQYPSIAPPTVTISATYPGASAETLANSVTQVIEQQMNGIDGLTYMSSKSYSNGMATITLTFIQGTNPDIAQVQVQNKLQLATPLLPEAVQRQGITVTKSVRNFLMVYAFYSADGSMDKYDLADYINSHVKDPLSRVQGVGELQVFGSQYAMRIWLDPYKLKKFNVTPDDVSSAIEAQNAQVTAGQIGGTPSVEGQELNATVNLQSRLQTPQQFRNILLRTTSQGANVYLKDVAKVEMGAENYNFTSTFNGHAATGIGIRLASGANALDTAKNVEAKIKEMSKFFPAGMKAVVPYDSTPFVKKSIEGVVHTLVEAVVLVFFIMYLFLQNFRATLIPTIAVPVVLLGTFAVLSAFGYTINTLTMFAMVLAIGLLVDDAIVVVENVERVMSEEGLSPKEATKKSMDQITGALVAIGLVLSAVFVPMAFMNGSTGVIYRQFSVTIVSAMALSVLVAMILTPALCATIMKPIAKGHHASDKGFFGWFNKVFDKGTNKYQGAVGGLLKRGGRMMIFYVLIIAAVGYLFTKTPTSLLPDEDQGVIFTLVQLPETATQQQTSAVFKKVRHYFETKEKKNVVAVFAVGGFSFAGMGQNVGIAFVKLKPWDERTGPGQDAASIAGRAMGALQQIKGAQVFAATPPAVIELGQANGFDAYLQDSNSQGHQKLMQALFQMLGMAGKQNNLVAVRPNGQLDKPEYNIDVDYKKAGSLGVSVSDITSTLSTAWGGSYVNDFIDRGRIKKVYVQGGAPYRMQPQNVNDWYVRNSDGDMVPMSAIASGHWGYGSPQLQRYNGLPAFEIMGAPAPGISSGDAMATMEKLAAKLPPGFSLQWTGLSYEEQQAGGQVVGLYSLSILVVFLCLAALYESWSIPFAVLLVIPLGVLGTLIATDMRDLSNDVYFQVALLTIIGLGAKNAILIVEFAKAEYDGGRDLIEATLDAVRMRLRPILMTSLAFGLGVVPLAISSGAGSGSQHAVGTGVLGGMVSSTLLGIFFVPLFFVIVERIAHKLSGKKVH